MLQMKSEPLRQSKLKHSKVRWLDQNYNILITICHNHTERHIMITHYRVTRIHNPYFWEANAEIIK
jgi:hypothetical protein